MAAAEPTSSARRVNEGENGMEYASIELDRLLDIELASLYLIPNIL